MIQRGGMVGRYTVSLDGEIVAESNNLITTAGRITILRFLASISSLYAASIAIGVSDVAPTVDDVELGFEVSSAVINLRSVDYTNSEILFKATFPVGERIVVKEIGMYPDNSVTRSSMIYYFDTDESWNIVEVVNLTDVRLGDSGIQNTAIAGGTIDTSQASQLNFGDLLLEDKLCLAFLTYDDNCDYIRLTFTDVNGDTMSADYVPVAHIEDPGTGQYQIIEVLKGDFTGQDKLWNQIVSAQFEIQAKPAVDTQITLDGFRTSDSNVPTGSEIVSKTSLGSEIIKEKDVTLDIQYSLSVPV